MQLQPMIFLPSFLVVLLLSSLTLKAYPASETYIDLGYAKHEAPFQNDASGCFKIR
jgi:hypothetical protein